MIFDWETALTRISIAILIGGLIGAEREYHDKSAGLRTLTLICVGSCLFTLVSLLLTNGTADRIASTIVTGIGFLGAGVIFKSEQGGVNGLTTAATIWTTAAIGMAIGNGLYIIASFTTLFVLIILSVFVWLEPLIDAVHKERVYTIVSTYEPDILHKYEATLHHFGLRCSKQKRAKKGKEMHFRLKVKGTKAAHDRFIDAMLKDETVTSFEF
jgi:putative Mg2+ transporter-C (MgtC) family protein